MNVPTAVCLVCSAGTDVCRELSPRQQAEIYWQAQSAWYVTLISSQFWHIWVCKTRVVSYLVNRVRWRVDIQGVVYAAHTCASSMLAACMALRCGVGQAHRRVAGLMQRALPCLLSMAHATVVLLLSCRRPFVPTASSATL